MTQVSESQAGKTVQGKEVYTTKHKAAVVVRFKNIRDAEGNEVRLNHSDAKDIRGFVAGSMGPAFSNYAHAAEKGPDRVMYRVGRSGPEICIYGEGSVRDMEARAIRGGLQELLLGANLYKVEPHFSLIEDDHFLVTRKESFTYRSDTLWLPWNPSNKENGRLSLGECAPKLEKMLVANILTLAKSMGVWFDEKVRVQLISASPAWTTVKQVPKLGYRVTFRSNVRIPEGTALGNAVSYGYGHFDVYEG